jgi:hypothetical protein
MVKLKEKNPFYFWEVSTIPPPNPAMRIASYPFHPLLPRRIVVSNLFPDFTPRFDYWLESARSRT